MSPKGEAERAKPDSFWRSFRILIDRSLKMAAAARRRRAAYFNTVLLTVPVPVHTVFLTTLTLRSFAYNYGFKKKHISSWAPLQLAPQLDSSLLTVLSHPSAVSVCALVVAPGSVSRRWSTWSVWSTSRSPRSGVSLALVAANRQTCSYRSDSDSEPMIGPLALRVRATRTRRGEPARQISPGLIAPDCSFRKRRRGIVHILTQASF